MDDKDIDKKLSDGIKKLNNYDIETPDFKFFTDMVKKEKAVINKKQNMQFAIFIALSFFIVAIVLVSFLKNMTAFIILQAVPFVILLNKLVLEKKARKE